MDYYLGNKVIFKKSKTIQLVLIIIMLELTLYPFPTEVKAAYDSGVNDEAETVLQSQTKPVETVENGNNSIKQLLATVKKEKVANINEKVEKELVIDSKREVAWSKSYAMTAYNSDVAQCDASPCITANGFNVCKHGIEDTVAANFLPFGTEIRIPELFGDRIFVVRDRMNSRYTDRVDVWFLHHDNAIDFGVKYAKIEVLK